MIASQVRNGREVTRTISAPLLALRWAVYLAFLPIGIVLLAGWFALDALPRFKSRADETEGHANG